MWKNRNESPDERSLRQMLDRKKPPKDPIKSKIWHCVQQNKKTFPDEKSLRELLDSTKAPDDPIKAKVWYYIWREESASPLSLRDILSTTKPPADPIKAELWYYKRARIICICGTPFMAYFTYGWSAASPGYQTLRRAGFLKWSERLAVINGHLNGFGLWTLLMVLGAIFLPYVQKIRLRHLLAKGGRP